MSKWISSTLGAVCADGGLIQTGPFGSQLHVSDYTAEGIPVIMPTNIADGRVDPAGIMRTSPEKADTLSRHKVQPGDIVYSRRGDITKRALIREIEAGWLCGTGCLLVRPAANVDRPWLSYWLAQPAIHTWLLNHSVGATMHNLNTGILSMVPVSLPPLAGQERIAGVLGAFDDLIETNRQLARQLQQLSESKFKQSTAGCPFVPLGNLVGLAYGKSLPARARRPGPFPVVSSAGITGEHDSALVPGPGVVVGRKGTVGSITWVREDFYPIDTTYFAKSDLAPEIVFHVLQSAGLDRLNTDSAVPGLNRERALQQLVPEVDVTRAKEIVSWLVPLMVAGDELKQETAQLTRQRDELLPLLMSGRVRVSELEGVA